MNEGFPSKGSSPRQILILPTMDVKGLQKNGITQAIEHAFVWHIIYKQHVDSKSIRINRKENVKVLVKIWLEVKAH